ncbi:MAG: YhgE/Pip domain-containing protein [Adlercreutzia equolifaciens]
MRVIWDIFSGDVRNLFRNVIAAIVVMGLALVPPMYAWFTTLGFWDPYDNTGNIKVAVASEDAGYTSDLIPTPVNAGEQIIGKLRANDQFAWQFVSAEAAVEGVRSGEYYAALVIPKEFSRDLMTVFSNDITEPKIIYYDNEKENAIAQRVTATGASTLQETIDETFTGNRGVGGLGHHKQPHLVHERRRHSHLRANFGIAPWRGGGRSGRGSRPGPGLRRSRGIHDLACERDSEHSEGGREGARTLRAPPGERGNKRA